VTAGVASAAASSDFVVVSCHWGQEYNHYSNDTQRRFARIATSAGARVVLGHHPHVLQGIEFGDSWVVAYSLGNFVFDQRQPGTQDSLILRITISAGHIVRVELLPCYIVDCRPVLLAGDLKRKALLELCRLSSDRAE
jgi:poly-gamma-glutamate synthesis protein (capsule biosynthesis protein)